MAAPPAPLVAVLGMHRSGTSAAAGLLHKAGAWLGEPHELMAANEANAEGFFERTRVVRCLDLMLKARGRSWDWPHDPTLLSGRYRSDEVELLALHLRAIQDGAPASAAVLAVKDPRLCLYTGLLPQLDAVERYVVCVRDPVAVAQSLLRVHSIPLQRGLALWEYYMVSVAVGLSGRSVTFFDFDRGVDDGGYRARLLAALGLPVGNGPVVALSEELRHFQATPARHELLTDHQQELWAALTAAAATGEGQVPALSLSSAAAALLDGSGPGEDGSTARGSSG